MHPLLVSFILFFALALPQSLAVNTDTQIFSDVSPSMSNADAIKYVKERGLVKGYEDGTFAPKKNINRYDFIKIIIAAKFSEDDISSCDQKAYAFPDVPEDQWFTPYVCTAKKNEIIKGYDDGTFRGQDNVSLLESLKIVLETYADELSHPIEANTNQDWYMPYVQAGETNGLIQGFEKEDIEKKISRGDMASYIYQIETEAQQMPETSSESTLFAQCVTESGAVFYGTNWCPHCTKQKEKFGENIVDIHFVDCDKESDLCHEKDITAYPTWIFGNGEKAVGTQSREELSKKTGCPLAQDEKIKEEDASFSQTDLPQKGDTVAIITTNMGDIKIRLFPDYAPKAVENFTTHAEQGYYNGTIFHRVIKDFMIQGGDPTGTGTGGESIWGKNFEDEFSPNLKNIKGALSMANAGPATNASQFFIVQKTETPWLDGKHTVFGQVYGTLETVDAIANVKTTPEDKPIEDVIIESIDIGEY